MSHHTRLSHVLLSRRPEQRKAGSRGRSRGVALGIALIHYSMEVGIKKFQERGKAGVTKELTQMHNMDVFQPVARESLKERAKALALLMFLKEKRDSL